MILTDLPKENYGYAQALGYYYGYLRIVLPGEIRSLGFQSYLGWLCGYPVISLSWLQRDKLSRDDIIIEQGVYSTTKIQVCLTH